MNSIDWSRAAVGDRVRIRDGGEGVLSALPDQRGRVAVQLGSARLSVPMERVGALEPSQEPQPTARAAPRITVTRADSSAGRAGRPRNRRGSVRSARPAGRRSARSSGLRARPGRIRGPIEPGDQPRTGDGHAAQGRPRIPSRLPVYLALFRRRSARRRGRRDGRLLPLNPAPLPDRTHSFRFRLLCRTQRRLEPDFYRASESDSIHCPTSVNRTRRSAVSAVSSRDLPRHRPLPDSPIAAPHSSRDPSDNRPRSRCVGPDAANPPGRA